jgi:uncharacterized membrane protein
MSLEPLLIAIGIVITLAGVIHLRRRAWARASFWILLGVMTAAATWVPDTLLGLGVIALAVLTLAVKTAPLPEREAQASQLARRHGARLLVPALILPLVTLALTLGFRAAIDHGALTMKPEHAALYALLGAVVIGLVAGWMLLKVAPPPALLHGAALLDSIGWPLALPLLLAVLGAVYAQVGVGSALAEPLSALFPTDNRYACVIAYCFGMALLTMLLGNAFAAFPVMTAAVGVPLVILQHGGHPAATAAMGMLAGYCGTLMTPLAANFNLVPVALLNLDSPYAVIRQQLATAIPLLVGITGLMMVLAY